MQETAAGHWRVVGSYTFASLCWLLFSALAGILFLDLAQQLTPLIASALRKHYGAKRVLDWDESVKAITSIIALIGFWAIMASPVDSLVQELGPLIDPDILLVSYHVMFGIAIAYYALSGVIRSKPRRSRQPEVLDKVSWNGLDDAVRMSRYLKRLEALRSSGDLDERTYEKLRVEYETKLRGAIELP